MKKLLFAAAAIISVVNIFAQDSHPRYYSDGRAAVTQDGKYGFIDASGYEVIPCRYDSALDFNNGIAMVRSGGELFAIDTMGNRLSMRVTTPQLHRSKFDAPCTPNIVEEFAKKITAHVVFDSAIEYLKLKDAEIYATITINSSGNTTNFTVLSSTDNEAAAKVEEFIAGAKWDAGTIDGKAVDLTYYIPIKFKWCKYYPQDNYPIDAKGDRISGEYIAPQFVTPDYKSFYSWFFRHYRHKNAEEYYRAAPGMVTATFIIDSKGRLRSPQIISSHNPACSETVLRALRKSPKWEPATVDGKPVSVRYTMDFRIKYRRS